MSEQNRIVINITEPKDEPKDEPQFEWDARQANADRIKAKYGK